MYLTVTSVLTKKEIMYVVLCMLVLLVVGINLGLVRAYLTRNQKKNIHPIDFKNIIQTTRNPWHQEDQDLKDLSDAVRAIKEHQDQEKGDKGSS